MVAISKNAAEATRIGTDRLFEEGLRRAARWRFDLDLACTSTHHRAPRGIYTCGIGTLSYQFLACAEGVRALVSRSAAWATL